MNIEFIKSNLTLLDLMGDPNRPALQKIDLQVTCHYKTVLINLRLAIECLSRITKLVWQLCKLGIWAALRCHDVPSKPCDATVRVSVEYSR